MDWSGASLGDRQCRYVHCKADYSPFSPPNRDRGGPEQVRQYLLPAWGYSRFVGSAEDIGLGRNAWWDKPPFNYPHTLISYVHWQQPFKFPSGAYVFGDSGGFTLRSPTRSLKIDSVDVLHWQASQCSVGCLLDVPPGIKKRIWDRALAATIDHTARALPHYERMRAAGSPFRWWGVLHGNSDWEVRQYHRAISEVYPFEGEGEGWAIRAEPTVNIYAVARSLRVLNRLGIKRAHFLAATSQDVIAVLLALGRRAGLELLTYDSAYAIKCGFNRTAFVPTDDGVSFTTKGEQDDERHVRDFLLNECSCEVCAFMRLRSDQVAKARHQLHRAEFGGWWSAWVQLHNLRIQQQLTEAQARAAESDPDRLLQMMLTEERHSLVMKIFEEDGHEPNAVVPPDSLLALI